MPSGKEFAAEETDTLLEAALRSGISLRYSCSNGACGDCRARLISGAVRETAPQDFHFSEAEKNRNPILLCSTAALSDLEIQVQEVNTPHDIPIQEIATRVEKLEHPRDDVMVLHLRTPRSQTLHFLAGQHATLEVAGLAPSDRALASCPCNAMHLEFHIRHVADDPFSDYVFTRLKAGETLMIRGPRGDFQLDETSTRPILFFAYETGFGPVMSIIQHAIALELPQPMTLYWLAHEPGGHYLENQCRAWEDALDNFSFTPLAAAHDGDSDPIASPQTTAQHFARAGHEILAVHPDLHQYDAYLAGPETAMQPLIEQLVRAGLPRAQLRVDFMQGF
ncbi:MAG: 2Fe-2S iron-sulfur cluster-binding protein [Betaproteobacteria bacterium]|nr:2Fe-2S iron-sulfur cluster-binding protein [Betaproteobacteria bacterium]